MAERGKSQEPAHAEARDIAENMQAVVRYLRGRAEHSQSADLRVLADLRALIEELEQHEEGESLEASETPIYQAVHRDRGGEGVLAHISEVFGEPAVQIRFSAEGVDPSHVNVVVEAEPAQARAEAGQVSVKTTEALPSVSERDAPVQMDDTYYDEVRQAVGRGAPSVLLGTSTKSLERGLEKLWVVHGASGASQTASRPLRAGRPASVEEKEAERMLPWRLRRRLRRQGITLSEYQRTAEQELKTAKRILRESSGTKKHEDPT